MTMADITQTLFVIQALFVSPLLSTQIENAMDTTCTIIPICRCNKEMTSVDCSHSGLKVIPDIPATALTLDLSVNVIDTIPTRVFSKLLKLENLDLRINRIQRIETFAFEGLESLVSLDLSANMIQDLPTRAFSKLSKLQTLLLDLNQLKSVEPYTFDGLHYLTTINMDGNNIHILKSRSFANIPRLNYLDLSFNEILEIAADAFTGSRSISNISFRRGSLSEVPHIGPQPLLSQIDLSRNQIVNASFPSGYRNRFDNLSIDLTWNKIETLDNLTFSALVGTTIARMVLLFNNINFVGAGTFDVFRSIDYLSLSYNSLSIEALENIADSCRRIKITCLDLSGSFRSQKILQAGMPIFMNLGIQLGLFATADAGEVFKGFKNLMLIRLTKTDIFKFSRHNFPGKKNVVAMDLADNKFKSFPKYLPESVKSIDLSDNFISELNKNVLKHLGNLRNLFLARNEIFYLWPGAFNGLTNLQNLDLAQNKIDRIFYDAFGSLQNLTHLNLGRNRITNFPKLSQSLSSLRVLDLSENGCEGVDSPLSESFPSLQILNLDGNNFGKRDFASEINGSLFRGLTQIQEVIISSNNIKNLPDWIFHDQISLKLLNISTNQISGWGSFVFKHTKNIAKLDISSNLISLLTENNLHDLKNLQQLYLKGNPFVCNCDLLWFREWIDSTSVTLPDKEHYKCHGPEKWRNKSLLEFNKDKINCTIIPTIIGAVSAALVFSLITGIAIYKNRWRLWLRVYLLSKRGRRFVRTIRGHKQNANYGTINDGDQQNYHDAYISCSDQDYDWALHHLLPDIDNGRYNDDIVFGGDFKLYFDPRDKEPGTMTIANIFEHMTRSKKVIVVLTQHYINDGMNIFELDQATTLYHDHDLEDIIVIKLGDVSARKVPVHLYTQMRTGRFLEWEDGPNSIESFKEKLKDRLRGVRTNSC